MNIVRILAILAILIPVATFAQDAMNADGTSAGTGTTEVRDTTSTKDETETTSGGVDEPDFGVTSSNTSTSDTGIEHEDIGVTEANNGEDDDCDGTEGCPVSSIEFTLIPNRIEISAMEGSSKELDKASPKLMEATTGGSGAVGGESEDIGVPNANNARVDSFFDVFVDLSDDDARAAVDMFIKIGDIKGESMRVDGLDLDDDDDGIKTTGAKSSKPKEIVVVGSKIREQVLAGNVKVRGWDPVKKEVIIKPKNIENGEEFLHFIGAVTLSDENIESVSLNFEKIKLRYDQPAKLFGFIPMSLRAQVEIDEKSQVKVKFPWYAFLTSGNRDEVREEIRNAVQERSISNNDIIDDIVPEVARGVQTEILSMDLSGAEHSQTDLDFLRERAGLFQTIVEAMRSAHDTASNSIRNMK